MVLRPKVSVCVVVGITKGMPTEVVLPPSPGVVVVCA